MPPLASVSEGLADARAGHDAVVPLISNLSRADGPPRETTRTLAVRARTQVKSRVQLAKRFRERAQSEGNALLIINHDLMVHNIASKGLSYI